MNSRTDPIVVREREKTNKYQSSAIIHHATFIPFVLDSIGRFGSGAIKLINLICDEFKIFSPFHTHSDIKRFRRDFITGISLRLRVGNGIIDTHCLSHSGIKPPINHPSLIRPPIDYPITHHTLHRPPSSPSYLNTNNSIIQPFSLQSLLSSSSSGSSSSTSLSSSSSLTNTSSSSPALVPSNRQNIESNSRLGSGVGSSNSSGSPGEHRFAVMEDGSKRRRLEVDGGGGGGGGAGVGGSNDQLTSTYSQHVNVINAVPDHLSSISSSSSSSSSSSNTSSSQSLPSSSISSAWRFLSGPSSSTDPLRIRLTKSLSLS